MVEETLPTVWSELKFRGKLCEGRSFATAIEYNGNLYFYGGYDVIKGVFNDFVSLKLSDTKPSFFEPVPISKDNQFYPGKFIFIYCFYSEDDVRYVSLLHFLGRLYRYGAIRRENKMIVFGGKPSSLSSTNKMFDYCFEK